MLETKSVPHFVPDDSLTSEEEEIAGEVLNNG